MNFKHGFDSNNTNINPDSMLLGNRLSLSSDELVDVENYLHGGRSKDVFVSNAIAVNILFYGPRRYPTFFPLAEKYRKTVDYKTLS